MGKLGIFLGIFLLSSTLHSAIVTYDFTNGDTAVPSAGNVAFGAFTRVGVIPSTSGSASFTSTDWPSRATLDPSRYVQFTVTPGPGYSFTLNSFSIDAIRGSSGPVTGEIGIFVGTPLVNASPSSGGARVDYSYATPTAWTGETPSFAGFTTAAGQPLTFRLYGINAANNGRSGELNFDNAKIDFTVQPVPEPIHLALACFGSLVALRAGVRAARSRRLRKV